MNPALQKTLVFLLLILAGYFLQRKINGKQDLKGVKVIILSVILPATIFVALLKIKISAELLLLPVGALALNLLLFLAARTFLPRLGFRLDSPEARTMLMLIPSLAPGLSCFPFVVEYLGDESLAMAALADVGNKVFVLIILYLLAMNWYYAQRVDQENETTPGKRGKLKDLGLSLLREPVNLVIVAAITMLCFGLDINALPAFLSTTFTRLAALMTPIVLLFIGMAVRFERKEMLSIFNVLAFRSGVGLIISGIALYFLPALAPAFALLLIIFPQSAVSFWPFAHMSAVDGLAKAEDTKVFNVNLALNVLACSLPFSTVVILSVLSAGTTFTQPLAPVLLGLTMLLIPITSLLRKGIVARKQHGKPTVESAKSVRIQKASMRG